MQRASRGRLPMRFTNVVLKAGSWLLLVVALLCGSGIAPQAYNLIESNGTPVTRGTTLNMSNTASVTWSCTTTGAVTACQATSTGSGGGYTTIQTNGTPLTQRAILNFTTNMTCVDDSGNTSTDCSSSGAAPTTNQNIRSISVIFDGAGSALSGTISRCSQVNYAGTIEKASIVADQSGSATVDVRTVAYSSYTGPASASTITASDTPALSSAVNFQDSTLTGWTTSLTANTVVCFVLSSPSTVTWLEANIEIAAN